MLSKRKILLGLVAALIVAEAVSGWARHKLAYELAVAGYTTSARIIYATLSDPLALNNYAALLDLGTAGNPNRAERQVTYGETRDLYNRAAARGLTAAEANAGRLAGK